MATLLTDGVQNAVPIPVSHIPSLEVEMFLEGIKDGLAQGKRLSAFFGVPSQRGMVTLFAVLSSAEEGTWQATSTEVLDRYPSLTRECPQAHWFEREILEQWGVTPEGHPWLKPIRFHAPYRGTPAAELHPGVTDYFQVEGEEVHEVAVGPVHVGVIEPGHFRFQCHGEVVFHLEISLGYQHRGIERALLGGPHKRSRHLLETAAGDTTLGHSIAYCQVLEALMDQQVPTRALAIRGIALELERLANHTGDLGALAGDVGFLPTSSYAGRLRGDFLNMTALLCGSRFGRGLVRPGGVAFDLEPARAADLQDRLEKTATDLRQAMSLLFETGSVLARFEETGTVSRETAEALGLVGVAARASGLERDVRYDFPTGMYRFAQLPVARWDSGDVFARAWVRWLEAQRSIAFISEQASALPEGRIRGALGPLAGGQLVVSFVEGWRGEICHVGITDDEGRFRAYKVVDPSFHNWIGLAMALRNTPISDFPLCNKSFNLSYCGHDL